jgi:hypothetical protein
MAWQANNDITRSWNVMGQTTLVESKTITTSTTETAVFVGKGLMAVQINVSALTLGTGFDTVNFLIQRNTVAAPTTWVEIGQRVFGDATGLGVAMGADNVMDIVNNDGDNQIRINAYVSGSATSVTYSATVAPVRTKDIA